MLATHPEADATTHSLACRLGRDLAALGTGGAALVVLVDRLSGRAEARYVAGPAVPAGDGVLRSCRLGPPTVVDAAGADASLRELAATWQAERLLVVPCGFGNDRLAVAVVPVAADGQVDVDAAARAADRFGAELTRTRLFGRYGMAA